MKQRQKKKAIKKWVSGSGKMTMADAKYIGSLFSSNTPFTMTLPQMTTCICGAIESFIKTICEAIQEVANKMPNIDVEQ